MQTKSFPMCLNLMLKLALADMSDCMKILVSIPIPVKLVDAKKPNKQTTKKKTNNQGLRLKPINFY